MAVSSVIEQPLAAKQAHALLGCAHHLLQVVLVEGVEVRLAGAEDHRALNPQLLQLRHPEVADPPQGAVLACVSTPQQVDRLCSACRLSEGGLFGQLTLRSLSSEAASPTVRVYLQLWVRHPPCAPFWWQWKFTSQVQLTGSSSSVLQRFFSTENSTTQAAVRDEHPCLMCRGPACTS